MPVFAIGMVPLIRHLHGNVRQLWHTDDSAAAGSLHELCQWWDKLIQTEQKFGYFVNLRKTNLLVKPHLLSEVELIVQGTEINTVADGQWYLIGGRPFVEAYVHEKVDL